MRALIAVALACCVCLAHGESGKEADTGAQAKKIADKKQGAVSRAASALQQHVPPVETLPPEKRREGAGEEGTEYWPSIGGYGVKVTDSLLVLFTLLLWIATRALVKDARKSSERQLRAYVGCQAPVLKGKFPKTFDITFKNYGQTPARNISGHLNRQWFRPPSDLPQDFPYIDYTSEGIRRSVLPLGSGDTLTMSFPIEEWEMVAAQKGEISLFVYGHLDYIDIFDRPRRTEFCWNYFGVWEGVKMTHILAAHGKHNDIQ